MKLYPSIRFTSIQMLVAAGISLAGFTTDQALAKDNQADAPTPDEIAANGPFPGDLGKIKEEWAQRQELDTPGYFKSINGAEVANAQRPQCYPAASFLGSMTDPNKVCD